jgi:hypothetical protein
VSWKLPGANAVGAGEHEPPAVAAVTAASVMEQTAEDPDEIVTVPVGATVPVLATVTDNSSSDSCPKSAVGCASVRLVVVPAGSADGAAVAATARPAPMTTPRQAKITTALNMRIDRRLIGTPPTQKLTKNFPKNGSAWIAQQHKRMNPERHSRTRDGDK